MSGRISVWTRIRRFFRPERETYDTRKARGGEPGAGLGSQYYEATDRRRSGGSAEIGGIGG
jgi:hypothetical protein